MRTSQITFKLTALILLIAFISAATGCSFKPASKEGIRNTTAAPKVYVKRCNFLYEGESCGKQVKDTIFQSSDEFLSFTDNWAVGRTDNYKIYMSCFEPGDEEFIDGIYSSLSIVVSGPNLSEAYEIANQLMADFSDQLGNSATVSHCIEK